MFIFNFQISANVLSQSKISLDLNNASLKECIKEIEKKTELGFLYNNSDIREVKNLNLSVEEETVDQILTDVLASTELTHTIENNVILIKSKKVVAKKVAKVENEEVQLPPIEITGVVKGEDGHPLPGANVFIKDIPTIGVTTNIDGEFSITVPNEAILVFSFVGYENKEISITDNINLNVVLSPSANELNEVVVTGYQTIERERMTGSAKALTAASIKNLGTTSVDDILTGAMSGINIVSTGRPGEDAQIQIRGVNSFTGNTDPLWIVDGMPMMGAVPEVSSGNELRAQVLTSGIGNISPEDIESITVLKDAAAAAIYGAQAANGVIVITTKSGHVGKTFFNVTSNIDVIERPKNDLFMMNSAEKVLFEKSFYEDWNAYDLQGRAINIMRALEYEEITNEEAERQLDILRNTNTNWFDEIFSTGISHQHSLSMSGGTEATQYYASANYLNEDGIEPNNNYNKLGLNMKLTHNPSDKVRVIVGLNTTVRNSTQTASKINPLKYAIYANPYEKVYNEDGSYAYDLTYLDNVNSIDGEVPFGQFNIIEDLNKNTKESKYISSDLRLKVEYEVIPGLTYSLAGAYNVNSNFGSTTRIGGTYSDYATNWHPHFDDSYGLMDYSLLQGSLFENTSRGTDYTFRNTLQYMKEFNKTHYVSIFGGQELRKVISNTSSNFFPTFDEVHRIGGYPDLDGYEADELSYSALGSTGFYEDKLSSFFMNGLYSYKDKYIFSGSLRYDGSSFVGNENQFTPLGNVSLMWNLHNEDFIKNFNIISRLSIKGGYGYTGSIDKKASPYTLLYFSNSNYKYDGQVLPGSVSFPSKNLKWQTKQDRNVGVELGLWKNRVEFGVNYFNNITEDVLNEKKLPVSSGRTGIYANVASILNKGWEFDFNSVIIQANDFTWMAQVNLTLLDNETLESYYPNLDEVAASAEKQYVEGYPVNGWFGYRFHSINPSDGHLYVYDNEGGTFDLQLAYNTTQNIEKPIVSYLGDRTPSYMGGVSTTFKYKQLSLRVSGDFKGGHKIMAFGANDITTSGKNKPAYLLDSWTQSGDITDVRRVDILYQPYSDYMFDTKLEDGDYFRISMLSLGYMFKNDLVSKVGIKTARINFNIRNLATFSKYKGIDPTLMGALDYPNTRRYSVSLNIGF